MKQLIIRHGDRVVRHELVDAVVIGRDAKCDLPFKDEKLSRRHCRIEATPAGVRFEDLGSRNGSFIGKKRVDVVELKHEQKVRLGSLELTVEITAPAPVQETVSIAAIEPRENKTVALGTQSLVPPTEHTPTLESAKTQMVPTELPPPKPPPPSTPAPRESPLDKTLIAPDEPKGPSRQDKTALLDAKAMRPPSSKGTVPDTMMLERDPRLAPKPPTSAPADARAPRVSKPPPPPSANDVSATNAGFGASLSWSARFLLVVSAVGLIVYVLLAFPLLRSLGTALREESLRRGRALLSVATAANGRALGEGRIREISVEEVLREERVKEALILDLEGNVVAPSSRASEVLSGIDGIDASIADIRTFYLGRRGGDYVMVQPLLHESRRVGLAVVVYEPAGASGGFSTAVLFLAFLVLALSVIVALVIGKRFTLVPMADLRDDVEAVIKGDADYVLPRQGFGELTDLATSINRLIARSHDARAVAAPAAPAPDATPTPTPAAKPSPARARPASPEASRSSARRPITRALDKAADASAPRFWVDDQFIVIRADEEAVAIAGATATGMEGKHLIEAVADQELLAVVLDAINALETLPDAEATLDRPSGGTLRVSAARDEGHTVVGLRLL